MKKLKITKRQKWIIVITTIIIIAITVSISVAWFTKKTIDDNFDLNFANVKIAIQGENTEAVKFIITNNNGEMKKKLMPGDKITANIKVINMGDVSCYYLVNFKAKEINFDQDYFYDKTTLLTNDINKSIGELQVGESHLLNLEKLIDTNLSYQGFSVNLICSVFAIQTKNITKLEAYEQLQLLKYESY